MTAARGYAPETANVGQGSDIAACLVPVLSPSRAGVEWLGPGW
jgi:hypothetical protein